MSERLRSFRRRRMDGDGGYTLIELLVSMSLFGLIVAVMSTATITVLRNTKSTTGRANNARSEQVVGMYMPGDLASAETVDTSATAVPCGPTPACPPNITVTGSNAVQLTWNGSVTDPGTGVAIPTKTVVSYRVLLAGTEYQMVRFECDYVGDGVPTCLARVVLHDLDPPPSSFSWRSGIDSPSWIITVSNALPPDDTQGPDATIPASDPGLKNKNGQRVVVTINGGGLFADGGGGQKQITLSAGGTNRESDLATNDLTGAPTFTAARSRCGGNFALLVDTSGSIGSTNMSTVRSAVNDFIDTFAGTPIKLEVVTFSDTASTLGATSGQWSKYYDMLVDTDVSALKSKVTTLASSGRTNWEDGIFRTLKNADGTVQSNPPNTILWFTDGVPTKSRLEGTSGNTTGAGAPVADPADAGLSATDGSSLYQIGWNRAERIIRDRGKVTLIGVFVGSTSATSQWETAGAGWRNAWEMGNTVVFQKGSHPDYQLGNTLKLEKGYHVDYQAGNAMSYDRGYHLNYEIGDKVSFQRGYHPVYEVGDGLDYTRGYHLVYERNNNVTFQLATASSNVIYEQGSGTNWTTKTASQFKSGNLNNTESDGWRIRVTPAGYVPTSFGTSINATQYANANIVPGPNDGVRTTVGSLSSSWTTITKAEYDLSNTTSDSNDGFRATVTYSSPYDSWETTDLSTYLANNTSSGATDGWQATLSRANTTWTAVTQAQYNASNTAADESDGWRTSNVYTAPYSSWENTTQALFFANNTVSGNTDGWTTATTGASSTWTTVSQAQYNAANTTTDATDGFRTSNIYTAPYDLWEASNLTNFLAGNTNSSTTDGWRSTATGTSTTWTNVAAAQYTAANSTSDATDGWRTNNNYTSPFDAWEPTTTSAFLTGNTNSTATDGWRSSVTGAPTSWTSQTMTSAQFAAADVTADDTDGIRSVPVYTSPFTAWENVSQAVYDAANTAAGNTDGWQTALSGTPTAWAEVTQAYYNKNNTTASDGNDGFRVSKSYTPPFTNRDASTWKSIKDYATLGNIIVDNTSGVEGGFVKGVLAADGKSYTNAAVSDLFVMSNYSVFNDTLQTIALGQCGGTVTMQTRVGSSAAQDPFTYQIKPSNEIVQTSAAYRSGTFDVALPGGASTQVTIAPQEFTDLIRYQPAGWSCKSNGAAYPFTTAPIAGHAPWTSITMTVSPNQAVSCIQQVTFS